MKLDLSRPALVVAGTWNPAIFSIPWVLHNLFEVPKGETVEVGLLQELVMPLRRTKNITMFREVGVSATKRRLEVFRNTNSEDVRQLAERVAIRAVTTLSHTPFAGFGCNFLFSEQDVEDDLFDKLKTWDKIDELYTIKARGFRWTIEMDSNVDLNFTASRQNDTVSFDFNYHHGSLSSENAEGLIQGSISRCLSHAASLLKKVYGFENYDIVERNLASMEEEEGT